MNRRAYVLAAITVFAANFVAVALRAYAEAAFLSEYGAKWLPLLLVGQAVGFAVGTTFYDQAAGRASSPWVDRALAVGLVVAAAGAAPLVTRGQPWPYLIAVGVVAVSSVVNVALWNTVAASVAGRDARRWLPRAGAAVTAGGALAGLGAAALVRRASADVVPWIACGVAVVVVGLTVMAQRALAAGGAPGATAPPGTSATAMGSDHRSLLRWLAAAAVLEAAVATAYEFGFGVAMKQRFAGADLVTAVSLFYGGTHLLLLGLQILIVPRLLTSSRLPVTVSIHPMIVALGAGLLALAPGFAAIAVVRTGDWVLRAATSRTGQEISLSALPPVPRARWKVLLRGGATPIGAALAGLVLYLIGPRVLKSPEAFGGVIAGVIVVWLVVVRRAARSFLGALAAPLGMRGVALASRERIGFELAAWRRLVDATSAPDPRHAELARTALARASGAADEITPYLDADEPEVRRALYELAARRPRPGAQRELRAAAELEDDTTALVSALDALAAHGARAGVEAVAARGVDDGAVERAVFAARVEVGALPASEREAAAAALVADDGAWAARLAGADAVSSSTMGQAAPWPRYDAAVAKALAAGGEARRQGLRAAVAGGEPSVRALLKALREGDRDAAAALADLDDEACAPLRARLDRLAPVERAAVARARAAAVAPGQMLLLLAADGDDVVRAAALRTLVGHARAGFAPAVATAAAAVERERAALDTLVEARPGGKVPAVHAAEVERALRRALTRLVHAIALATSAAGRDPVPALAAGRRVVESPDAARRRALDVLQELATAPLTVLDAIERALRPPPADATAEPDELVALEAVDPWLAALLRGEHAADESALAALRSCSFFDSIAGRNAAAIARDARRRVLADGDVLIRAGDTGDAMFVVLRGELRIEGAPDAPPMAAGSVVGELALVDDAPRAVTLVAAGEVELLQVERAAFAAAIDQWPELGLALLRTLAGRIRTRP